MSKVIQFRTRDQWEEEKKSKMLAEWEAYLAWEAETLKRAQREKEEDEND